MKSFNYNTDDDFDYEPYEERSKGKIKSTDNRVRREIKNWKKVWVEHESDYEERDEFHAR